MYRVEAASTFSRKLKMLDLIFSNRNVCGPGMHDKKWECKRRSSLKHYTHPYSSISAA